jgi:hypothetical protein
VQLARQERQELQELVMVLEDLLVLRGQLDLRDQRVKLDLRVLQVLRDLPVPQVQQVRQDLQE